MAKPLIASIFQYLKYWNNYLMAKQAIKNVVEYLMIMSC